MYPPETNTGRHAPHTREVPALRCSFCGRDGGASLAVFSDGTPVGPEGWVSIETRWTGRIEGYSPAPLRRPAQAPVRTVACSSCAPTAPWARPDAACLTCEGAGEVWLRKPDPGGVAPSPRLVACTTCNGSGRVAP